MKTTGVNNPLVLPPALLAGVEAVADEEHRPVADVLRDLVERGLGERRWKTHAGKEIQRRCEQGLPDDALPLTYEYRRDLREKIARGLQSLRDGQSADGEAFTARMDAELAELEPGLMRAVVEKPAVALEIGRRGQTTVRAKLSARAVAETVRPCFEPLDDGKMRLATE